MASSYCIIFCVNCSCFSKGRADPRGRCLYQMLNCSEMGESHLSFETFLPSVITAGASTSALPCNICSQFAVLCCVLASAAPRNLGCLARTYVARLQLGKNHPFDERIDVSWTVKLANSWWRKSSSWPLQFSVPSIHPVIYSGMDFAANWYEQNGWWQSRSV